MTRRTRWWIAGLLLAVAAAIWLYLAALRGDDVKHGVLPTEPFFSPADVHRKGSFNGVPIAVRGDYLQFPITYTDKSDWEPASSPDYYDKKDYRDAIQAFSVVVRWPSMEPRKPSNDRSWPTYRSGKPTEWITIAAASDLKPGMPDSVPGRLARRLQQDIARVSESPRKRVESDGREAAVDLRYEMLGVDPTLGLHIAKTVGRDAKRPGGGNRTLYWRGELQGIVETAIRCPAGALPVSGSVHTCDHHFDIPELGAAVTVLYTEDLLPEWKQIEDSARRFILELRVDTAAIQRR